MFTSRHCHLSLYIAFHLLDPFLCGDKFCFLFLCLSSVYGTCLRNNKLIEIKWMDGWILLFDRKNLIRRFEFFSHTIRFYLVSKKIENQPFLQYILTYVNENNL